MSKSGAMFMDLVPEEESQGDSIDPQEAAQWQAYCSMKEVLNQDVYMEYFGKGDFESFVEEINRMNKAD